jgi:hypothetical protein
MAGRQLPWLSAAVRSFVARMWPRCGPLVPSLEGASGQSVHAGCYAGAAGQILLRSFVVDRDGIVRNRGYGHVEGTAGEDEAGSGVAGMVTSPSRG